MDRLILGLSAVSLPMFLLGIAVGLWTKRLWCSLAVGLVVGLCFAFALLYLGIPSIWLSSAIVAAPAIVGSLVGHKSGSKSSCRKRVLLSLFLCVLAPIIFAWVNESAAQPGSHRAVLCVGNLKQIGMALAMYSDNYQGHLPPEPGVEGLNLLRVYIINATRTFHCPKDTIRRVPKIGDALTEDTCSYVYVPGIWQSVTYTNKVPICWDKPDNHGAQGLNVLFNDGHVSWLTLEEWQKIRPVR